MSFELEGKINPAGTMYLGLIDMLIDLFKGSGVSNVEVNFISYRMDDKGQILLEDGQDVVEIRPFAIGGLSTKIREELKKEYDSTGHLISLIVFLVRSRFAASRAWTTKTRNPTRQWVESE
jgi:hypothetical protein